MNQPDTSAPARAALGRFEAGRENRPWFRWINKPTRVEPEVLTLSGHTGPVLQCAYAADKHQIVSFSQQVRHYADESDNHQPAELIWWNAATGVIISTHPLDVELITASAFSSDARLLALAVNPFRPRSKDPRLSDPGIPRSIKLIDSSTGSLIGVLPGCHQQIRVCSFSRDGQRLLTGDSAGTVKVWDLRTHQELLTISAHDETIRLCAFSPNGNVIATADTVNLKFWDANSGENLRTLDHHPVFAGVFLSDQRFVATTNELSIIDVDNGEVLFSDRGGGFLLEVLGASPDLPIMVTGQGGTVLRLWHSDTLADIGSLRGHEEAITSIAFLQTARQIASSAKDGTVRIWELPRVNELATVDTHKEVRRVAFLGNTNHIVAGGDDEFIRIWKGDAAEELLKIPVGRGISALACSIDSSHVAAGMWWYENSTQQGFLAVWRIEENTATKVAEVDAGCASCAYSSDGKFLAAVNEWINMVTIYTGQELEEVVKLSEDGWRPKVCTFARNNELLIVVGDDFVNRLELRFFRTADWKELKRLKTGQWRATGCAASPDGNLVAATSKSSGLAIVDLRTGKVTTLDSSCLTSCAFSPDSRRLICGTEDKTVEIWDLPEGKKVGVLAGHSARVSDCDWSRDGRRVASCSQDGSLRLWDPAIVAESSSEAEIKGSVSACRYSPDNAFVLATGIADSSMKIWSIANGTLVSELPGRLVPSHFNFAFDLGYVIASNTDGDLTLFTREGQMIRRLDGNRIPIESLAVSPQGERLAVATGWFKPPKLYDARTFSEFELSDFRHQEESFSRCSFSHDGSILIAGSDQRLLFLDARSTQPRYEIGNESYDRGGRRWSISPDGGLLAVVGKRVEAASGNARILTLGKKGEIISCNVEEDVGRFSFSPDGRYFALTESKLRIWDVRTGQELNRITEDNLSSFQYSADGTRLWVVAGERIRVFDAITLAQESEFVANQTISSFDVAVDGKSLAIGGVHGNIMFLNWIGRVSSPPVMTAVCFYNFDTKKWSNDPAIRCPWCGIIVRVRETVVEAIREIQAEAKLSPADVPSRSLPEEAWSDRRLLSDCIACSQPIKFNPFMNTFHNRLPQPAGGGPAGLVRKLWRNSR
jgi:WD40 repeat protein